MKHYLPSFSEIWIFSRLNWSRISSKSCSVYNCLPYFRSDRGYEGNNINFVVQWAISRSSQCFTTGVTKAVVCEVMHRKDPSRSMNGLLPYIRRYMTRAGLRRCGAQLGIISVGPDSQSTCTNVCKIGRGSKLGAIGPIGLRPALHITVFKMC